MLPGRGSARVSALRRCSAVCGCSKVLNVRAHAACPLRLRRGTVWKLDFDGTTGAGTLSFLPLTSNASAAASIPASLSVPVTVATSDCPPGTVSDGNGNCVACEAGHYCAGGSDDNLCGVGARWGCCCAAACACLLACCCGLPRQQCTGANLLPAALQPTSRAR